MTQIKKYSLEELAMRAEVLSEQEQKLISGGWFYNNGYYYITQSELVDILGDSRLISHDYESAMVLTSHNEDYSIQQFTHYYRLTPAQFEEVQSRQNESSSSSGGSSSNTSNTTNTGEGSTSGNGETPSFQTLSPEQENHANSIALEIYTRFFTYIRSLGATYKKKDLDNARKIFKESVLAVFYRVCIYKEQQYRNYNIYELEYGKYELEVVFSNSIESKTFDFHDMITYEPVK